MVNRPRGPESSSVRPGPPVAEGLPGRTLDLGSGQLVGEPVAQFSLEDLAVAVLRQLVDELIPLGPLEPGGYSCGA